MPSPLLVKKISEEYDDYILTSSFLCTFVDYMQYIKGTNRRLCLEKDLILSEGISAKLKAYPTGVQRKHDGFVSIYMAARWKKSKSIAIKFDTTVLDIDKKRIMVNSSENFEEIPAGSEIGDPQVMHSNLCFDKKYKFLDKGRLSILINVCVNFEMMTHPDMLEKFERDYKRLETGLKKALANPSYGDTILLIDDRRYYVKRKILIRGNPMFETFFDETMEVDGCYQMMNCDPDVMEHILLDCYLNGNDNGEKFLGRSSTYK